MRDYIIINGKDSRTITGLLIQRLPPVSKPLMRTEIEEIDGRNGDIITDLGFSAYDKELEIGLYGNFNINEVISFFNSSGKITFSNEPDKYYNFSIVQQIDFEKLLRFRTATVTIHVQPFKYLNTENNIFSAYSFNNYSFTNNGVTVTVDGKKITIKGKTVSPGGNGQSVNIPINIPLLSGDRKLAVTANGKNAETSKFRITKDYQHYADADTFGYSVGVNPTNYFPNNSAIVIEQNLSTATTYTNIRASFAENVSIDFTVTISNAVGATFTINNIGNCDSAPIFTINGAGETTMQINDDEEVLTINIGDNGGSITINAETLNAYSNGVMKNRNVNGNYDDVKLRPGINVISFTGTVGAVFVEKYSRWL
jgi:phage-related protein